MNLILFLEKFFQVISLQRKFKKNFHEIYQFKCFGSGLVSSFYKNALEMISYYKNSFKIIFTIKMHWK